MARSVLLGLVFKVNLSGIVAKRFAGGLQGDRSCVEKDCLMHYSLGNVLSDLKHDFLRSNC